MASEAQLFQVELMVKRSQIILMAASPGDNVTITVPLVDRGRGDLRNILGVVHNRDEKYIYSSRCSQM